MSQDTKRDTPHHPCDPCRRRFMKQAGAVLGATLAAPLVARAAGTGVETVDIRSIPVDGVGTTTFKGQPIVILNRSRQTLAALERDQSLLADPLSKHSQQPAFADNPFRSRVPEWLVMVNVCTHRGCPTAFQKGMDAGAGGFYCPCHGSRFDAAGRVYKNQPAPWNMEIPDYEIDTKRKQIHLIAVQPVRLAAQAEGGEGGGESDGG